MINPNSYIDSNVLGFLNIINLCKQFEIEKLIYASSSSVYGSSKDVPYKEESTPYPISLYGKTKLINEVISESTVLKNSFHSIGLRFFTVYGPYGRPDMAYYKFSKKIKENLKIKIYNKGNMSRDMTYIDDIIQGVLRAINYAANPKNIYENEIFNLGNDAPIKTKYMLNTIEKYLGKKAIIQQCKTNNENFKTHANITKAKNLLGYEPRVSFDEGIERFLDWYKYYENI